jgi:D-threo-aldose 1-dehydrogenase
MPSPCQQIRSIGRTDLKVTSLGFGSAWLGAVGAELSEAAAVKMIETVFGAGLNYFDTAPLYGHGLSEKRLGNVLTTVPRDDFVLSTKVGRLLVDPSLGERNPLMSDTENVSFIYDYSYDGARRSIEDSLERLKLDRIDIVYCHDIDVWTHGDDQPRVYKEAVAGILPALCDLRREGTIGAFGLGVNEWEVCDRVMDDADIDCFLLAGRFTLLEQEPLQHFLPKCVDNNTSIVIGGPFNSGLLVANDRSKATFDYKPVDDARWHKAQAMRVICDRHNVELAAAALQYPLRHAAVSSVIPGCADLRQLQANIDLANADIPDALWHELADTGHAPYISINNLPS